MKAKLFTLIMASAMALSVSARDAAGLKIYINPGHGGHDGGDRPVTVPPYEAGDPNGYWESNSNLDKGLALRDMLQAKGYTVEMSRVTNTDDDDLPLSTIVNLSNKSKADLFFSIHSNATGTSSRRNFPLMLFRGYDNDPERPNSLKICQILNKYLLQNQATYWTSTNINCRGDWSFYTSWGDKVGLGVLRGNNIDGMLSEGSFHDYIPETYRLLNKDFCWLEAWHFRKAIDEFFDVPGVENGVVAGRLNDVRVLRDGQYTMFGEDKMATIQGAKVSLIDVTGNVVDTYTTEPQHINGFYLFKEVKPGHYTVKAEIDTHFPVQTEVDVVADEVTFANMTMQKQRVTPPEVISYSPVWKEGDEALLCNTPITFNFNWDMDVASTEAAFKIDPPVEGKFTWEDINYRMVFTPTSPYLTNTVYTVTLDKSAKHAGMTPMNESVSFKFATTDRNFMSILGSFPKQDEEVHYKDATIEFRFDKLPNCTGIQKKLNCTDSQGNTLSFDVRNMKNSKVGAEYGWFRIPLAKPLTPGETYTLKVDGTVADKDGITIPEPITLTFKAVDASNDKGETNIIDDMATPANYALNTEGSIACSSATVAQTKTAQTLFGAATSFTYKFDADEAEVLFKRTSTAEKIVNPGKYIGVHLNGDLTGNKVYLEFMTDIATQYLYVGEMDFLGWRYFAVPANLETAGKLSGVKIVRNPSQSSSSGTFSMDNIYLTDDANSVENIEISSLTVYPNPASEYLIANADCTIRSIELYSAGGVKVAHADGNILNVSEVAEGTYFAVISTSAARSSKTIIIKH